jgi:hypothetical protein
VSRDVLDLIDGAISACDYAAMPDAMRWTTEPEKAPPTRAPRRVSRRRKRPWEIASIRVWIDEVEVYLFSGPDATSTAADRVTRFAAFVRAGRRRRLKLSRMRRLYRARR